VSSIDVHRQHYNVTFTLLVALAVPTGAGARKIAGFRQLEVGEWQRR
jgi:hypothetical protein